MNTSMETNFNSKANSTEISDLNIFLMLALALLLGVFGAHRFYAGRYVSAVFQLLTLGGLGIWALVDFIIIAFGEFKDGNGLKVKRS